MLLNYGFGEDSWESLGLQGGPTSQSSRKSVLSIHWKDWCWSWSSKAFATWFEELTYWNSPWGCKESDTTEQLSWTISLWKNWEIEHFCQGLMQRSKDLFSPQRLNFSAFRCPTFCIPPCDFKRTQRIDSFPSNRNKNIFYIHFIYYYLFIWLCKLLATTCVTFYLHCSMHSH